MKRQGRKVTQSFTQALKILQASFTVPGVLCVSKICYALPRAVLLPAFCFILVSCGEHVPAPYRHYGLSGGADSAGVHTVRSGDTVWNIAERYNLSMQDVINVNNLRAPYTLTSGQRLKLPPPNTYTVRPEDTLYTVSRTFNVSMTDLARQNDLREPYRLEIGQTLRLPSLATQRQAATGRYHVKPDRKPTDLSPPKRAFARLQAPKRTSSRFAWPVDGPVISTHGPKKDGLHNDGINIAARRGTPVLAAENGVVVYADSQLKGYGNLVLIRHEDQWMTAYAHLGSIMIRRGQEVRRGDKLGTVGSSGSVDRPQLHFEVRRGTDALDPMKHLAQRGS